MTVTLNPWVAWLAVALALGGLWSACTTVADVVRGVWDWWRDRRPRAVSEIAEEGDPDEQDLCSPCMAGSHCDGSVSWCICTCTWPEDWDGPLEALPLAPERSREELGFTGPQPAIPPEARQAAFIVGDLGAHRERWAPAWEAEARGAYQALDLDYPSGLLARVREQA